MHSINQYGCLCLNIPVLVNTGVDLTPATQNHSPFFITLLREKAKSISHDSLFILLLDSVDTGGVPPKLLHCQLPIVSTTKDRQHKHIQCVKVICRIVLQF